MLCGAWIRVGVLLGCLGLLLANTMHVQAAPLPWWHPRIQQTSCVQRIPAPAGHPPVNALARQYEQEHPNLDGANGLLYRPRCPGDHPNIDRYFAPVVAPNPVTPITVGAFHPNMDTSYAAGTAVNSAHPSIQQLMASALPVGHPNVDTLLANPRAKPLPSWHPKLEILIRARRPAVTFTTSVATYHPNIDQVWRSGTTFAGHPSVHARFAAVLPQGHVNLDTFIANPLANPIPAYHPPIANYVKYDGPGSRGGTGTGTGAGSGSTNIMVGFYHQNLDTTYAKGVPVDSRHPKMHAQFAAAIPSTHPNIDTLLANPAARPIPSWHPRLETLIAGRRPAVVFTTHVNTFHPNIDQAWRSGTTFPNHPTVQTTFASVLPVGHPNLDTLIANPAANPIPSYHPPISTYVKYDGAGAGAGGGGGGTGTGSSSGSGSITKIMLGAFHPNLDTYYAKGTPVDANHPKMQAQFAPYMPSTHPNVDTLLANPKSRPIPSWHPTLESLIAGRRPPVKFTTSVNTFHPNVDTAYRAAMKLPSYHPTVHSLYAVVLPQSHPNIDMLIANPAANPIPPYHPPLNNYIKYDGQGATAVHMPTISISLTHPNIDASYARGMSLPADHPSVQQLMAASLPQNHPNIDSMLADPLSAPLPSWHPSIESMVVRRSVISPGVVLSFIMTAWFFLAAIIRFILKQRKRQQQRLFSVMLMEQRRGALPAAHVRQKSHFGANKTDEPYTPNPLLMSVELDTQPAASGMNMNTNMEMNTNINNYSNWNADINRNINMNMNKNMNNNIHPNLPWQVSKEGIPSGSFVRARHSFTRANASVVPAPPPAPPTPPTPPPPPPARRDGPSSPVAGAGYNRGFAAQPHRNQPPLPQRPPTMQYGYRHYRTDTSNWGPSLPSRDAPLPPRDMVLYQSAQLHAQHRGVSYYDKQDIQASGSSWSVPMPVSSSMSSSSVSSSISSSVSSTSSQSDISLNRSSASSSSSSGSKHRDKHHNTEPNLLKKRSNRCKQMWASLTMTRIPHTQWTTGNLLFLGIFMLLNFMSILIAGPSYSLDRSFGSLAAANTMFLIIPATRNNVLTWVLGKPFDHVVLYHRFLGRFTIAVSSLHFVLYFNRFVTYYTHSYTYLTGLGAWICGMVIAATTADWIRRRLFGVFFWAHYSFIGFFGLAYAHHPQARPFLIVGFVLYALDKFIRVVWMWFPRRTLLFRARGSAGTIAQVRFPKNPLTKWAGMHKVGQYFFVNFPELSLTEWHPFSVSCGPDDDYVELHIRALGDHTKQIVDFAKKCGDSGRLPWIRMDGPYGVHDFNYRRYDSLFLVGGGVGITPVIGIIKDIYLAPSWKMSAPHAMSTVYVIWVMPDGAEASVFRELLDECMAVADQRNDLPTLVVYIYCTRAKEGSVAAPLIAGRPNFPRLLDESSSMSMSAGAGAGAGSSSCWSTLVFACGPELMVNQLWDECNKRNNKQHRVDFHHETFEF